MSINNWYSFYVGDYMRDTAHLSILEHGAYRLLLDHYYATAHPLPDDLKQLYRICRAFDEQEQSAIQKVLHLFFKHEKNEGVFTSQRVEKELKKKDEISIKRSKAAKSKGSSKLANAKQMQSKCKAIDDTSTSTSTSTITSKKYPPTPQGVSDDNWVAFIEMRKSKKAINSERAISIINNKLDDFRSRGFNLNDVIEKSIESSWTTIYEPKKGSNHGKTNAKESLQKWLDKD